MALTYLSGERVQGLAPAPTSTHSQNSGSGLTGVDLYQTTGGGGWGIKITSSHTLAGKKITSITFTMRIVNIQNASHQTITLKHFGSTPATVRATGSTMNSADVATSLTAYTFTFANPVTVVADDFIMLTAPNDIGTAGGWNCEINESGEETGTYVSTWIDNSNSFTVQTGQSRKMKYSAVYETGDGDVKPTDVPEGTRYEETNTRKIYRRVVGALDNTTGLRFQYNFDEASGNVINYGSVADADLTVSGLTRDVSTPSGLGNGMSTPNRNSNDYAENTSRVDDYKFMHDGTAKWSVTFWAYLTEVPTSSTNTEHGCMGNIWTDDAGIGWTIRWAYDVSPNSSTSCRIQTFIGESNTTGQATMPLNDQSPNAMMPELNAWHFYCVTYDPTESSNHLTVTRDAATSGTGFHQGSEDNDTYSSSNPTRKVTFFARPTPSLDLGMGGRLAQVTIWEGVILTQDQKVSLYNGGNGISAVASAWKEKGTA